MRSLLTLSAMLALGASMTPTASMAAIPLFGGSKVLTLHAQNHSGEFGTVTLKPKGAETEVKIDIVHRVSHDVAQPAHIHPGSCENLNPVPKYPLTPVVNGKSDTVVPASLTSLMTSGFAVNVHKSAAAAKIYVACANLK